MFCSFKLLICLADVPFTELVLLFEVGVWPPHDGVRRMTWFNLSGALAASAAGSAAVTNSCHPSSP